VKKVLGVCLGLTVLGWGAVEPPERGGAAVAPAEKGPGLRGSPPTGGDGAATKGHAPWVDVRACGAKGDGLADDTAAITAAIRAAAQGSDGGVVYFPPGTYRSNGGHDLPRKVSVLGAGPQSTTVLHRGARTYLFSINNTDAAGPHPPDFGGKVGRFKILGQSGRLSGTQTGIRVLNCVHYDLEDISCGLLHTGFLIDGGSNPRPRTFAGMGLVCNCRAVGCYRGFHITNHVTASTFVHIYGYGASPTREGSVGLWVEGLSATNVFLHPHFEGWDVGYKIATTGQSGQTWLGPRVENCTTKVLWQNGSAGHVILGGNEPSLWASGAKAGSTAQLVRDGYFPAVRELPPPGPAYRHAILRTQGGDGTRDALNVCVKEADGSYVWRDLVVPHGGEGGAAGLLACKTYDPVGPRTISTAANSTAPEDVDPKNLSVTFTAPPSGAVLVRLTGLASRAKAGYVVWNLRAGSGDVPRSAATVHTTGNYGRVTHAVTITGLTPGQRCTWKWGQRITDAAGSAQLRVGGGDHATTPYGPATMEVWAAP
jgi:hypothetical protein